MKNYIAGMMLLVLSTFTHGEVFLVSGEVVFLSTKAATPSDPVSYTTVQISGVSNIANCYGADRGNGSLTFFNIDAENSNIFSVLLAAKMAGKKIQASVDNDNSRKISTLCVLDSITINNSL